jgi:hypothetical protein
MPHSRWNDDDPQKAGENVAQAGFPASSEREKISFSQLSARQSRAYQVAASNGSIAEGLIRPVSAIGKRYVMTAGMRFQYQTIAV